MRTRVKTNSEQDAMRESGKMLATVLDVLRTKVEIGISTKQLADIAEKELKALGGEPAFFGYQGFPEVLCTSVNEEVVHGIPKSNKVLKDGDILSMDFGVLYKGMITDSAISVIVGVGDKKTKQLLKNTERSMYAGIEQLKDGVKTGDIGAAVQKVLDEAGLGVVRELVGHGVGHFLHEEPNIPNVGIRGTGSVLSKGMTIAIEPMATMGNHRVAVADDDWTVFTKDKSLSAHFEHTVLITADSCEILTEL